MRINQYPKIILIIWLTLFLVIGWVSYLTYETFSKQESRVGFVDLNRIYADFSMTQDYENQMLSSEFRGQYVLDSLNLELQRLQGQDLNTDEDSIRTKLLALNSKIRQLQEAKKLEESQEVESANKKIWGQINAYLKEFGVSQEYDFIYGASGSGNIMFADEEAYDVTNEVIAFMNRKYSGE